MVLTPSVQNKSLTAIGIPGNLQLKFGLLSNFLALFIAMNQNLQLYNNLKF